MSKPIAKIVVQNAGINFAHYGVVKNRHGRTVGVTRDVPYGMRYTAYQLACNLAEELGYSVPDDDA